MKTTLTNLMASIILLCIMAVIVSLTYGVVDWAFHLSRC